MKSEFFLQNITNPVILIPKIFEEWKTFYEWESYKQYRPELHAVNQLSKRPNKTIYVPYADGRKNPDGSDALYEKIVQVNRLAIPLQYSITTNKTAFTTGGKIKYKSQPDGGKEAATFKRVMQTLKREKTDPFKNSEVVKALLSQTECCEIWYTDKDKLSPNDLSKSRIKCNVYTPADGNKLIPVFDEHYDLIAFGLGYERKEGRSTIDCLDLYDDEKIRKYEKGYRQDWVMVSEIEHLFKKIPVIYYSIRQSCWHIVQPLIERVEFLLSNHADTNDYNGSPILFGKGDIKGFSAKGETGKVIEGSPDASLEYIEAANTPESIKMEWENLLELIYTTTQSPNPSMENMAKLTTASGAAIERMLMNAHIGAMDLQNGPYGLGIQRRLNLIISGCANIYTECAGGESLDITPEFGLFRLDNTREQVEIAKLAKEAGLADDLSILAFAGLVDDPEAALKLIKNQRSKESAANTE